MTVFMKRTKELERVSGMATSAAKAQVRLSTTWYWCTIIARAQGEKKETTKLDGRSIKPR